VDKQEDGRTDTRSQRPLILPLRKTYRSTFDLPPPHNGKVRVRKFFSHRSTYVSPICSKMISHCISSYPACSLARLESNSVASAYPRRRSKLFLIQRSLKSSNGQQSISTAQNLNARSRRGRQIPLWWLPSNLISTLAILQHRTIPIDTAGTYGCRGILRVFKLWRLVCTACRRGRKDQ
jgi:hypothetical protein